MVWCYLCLVSFVDQIIQLKLVGEYYVKSFVKTTAWFAIMCMCHSKGMFSLFFSVRRRGRRERGEGQAAEVVVCGSYIHWPWKMEIVSKTLYCFFLFEHCLPSMVVVKTITVTISYLTATMVRNYTKRDSVCWPIVVLIQSTTLTDHKILGLCPNKVSHGSRCKVFLRQQWFGCKGRDTVGCLWIGGLQASMHMACCPGY